MVFLEGIRSSLAGLANEELPEQTNSSPRKNQVQSSEAKPWTRADQQQDEPILSDEPRLLVHPTDVDYAKLERALGKGPMRFAPLGERPIQEQVESLAGPERACFDRLKAEGGTIDTLLDPATCHVHDELYLRFARCADFKYELAASLMKNWLAGSSYFTLRCSALEEQLLTETLFIPPGLKTNNGLDVFYMRPSNYFPKETPTSTVINNLAYVLQVMEEKESSSANGVAFIANMKGWTRHNFSLQYCFEFMQMLQGKVVPAKVQLFLIVDPPVWFDIIYKIIHEMLSKEFAHKVHLVKAQDLNMFLEEGYSSFLPSDMEGGNSKNRAAVADFVRYRRNVEGDGESDLSSYLKTFLTNVGRG